MISAAQLALSQIVSPPFRAVLWKSVGLTLALLAALWIAVQAVIWQFLVLPFPWMETAFSIASGLGLLIGMAFLIAPVTTLFAGLFLDDVAQIVETETYPDDPAGTPVPIVAGMVIAIKFFGVVVAVNLVALPLLLLFGFGVLVFFAANGYLLGREFFQFAAMRFHDERTVKALRLRHGGRIFLAGLMIAGFMAVPFVNLLTPLFATAFMVHIHKRIEARESRPDGLFTAV
ncbi:MAG TPA: sulfate transporter family protein [Afifellaceae bacterium]|nr:sulfate transporter family protein [Afifellaceae bacterium]